MKGRSTLKIFLAAVVLISGTARAQMITTVAGNGSAGYTGDGGPANSGELHYPFGVAFDHEGNFYVADAFNGCIRKITPSGIISTVAGNGTGGFFTGDNGDGGPAVDAGIYFPTGVAFDTADNMYIADGSQVIRKVNSAGIISTVAGINLQEYYSGDGGLATAATFYGVYNVAFDANNNMYVACQLDGRIRMVNPSGIITTYAGGGYSQSNGGAATDALLSWPYGMAFDAAGDMYIADVGDHRVWMVNTSGIINVVAGNGTGGTAGDGGPAVDANLFEPTGVAVDACGKLYITNEGSNNVRMVDTAGIITTVVGIGTAGYSGDGGPATAAQLAIPFGMAFDGSGNNLYIVDYGNNVVREVAGIGNCNCVNATAGNITNSDSNRFCTSGSDTLLLPNASIGLGITYQWISSTDGTNWTLTTGDTTSYYTGTLTTTTYYRAVVTCTVSGRGDTTAIDTIKVIPPPAPPVITGDNVYCPGAAFVPFSVNGQNVLWYATDTGGVGSAIAPTVNTNAPGIYTYYAGSDTDGCMSARDSISVTVESVTPAPAVITPVYYCQYATATALSINDTNTVNWYAASSGGTPLPAAPIPATSIPGETNYYISQTSKQGCESQRAEITVQVYPQPDTPVVTAPAYCRGVPGAPLAATGDSLLWYTTPQGGVGSATAIPSTADTGDYYYYVTQTINGCESPRATADVHVFAVPPAPYAPVVDYCQDMVPQSINIQGGDLLWYITDTGGTGTSQFPTPATTLSGSVAYYVSQTVNGCESGRTAITVESCCEVYMPDAFSPNGDGKNDVFRAISANAEGINILEFSIYDRWGKVVYEGTGAKAFWDGTYDGTLAPIGTYFYYMVYTCGAEMEVKKKGDVTLVR